MFKIFNKVQSITNHCFQQNKFSLNPLVLSVFAKQFIAKQKCIEGSDLKKITKRSAPSSHPSIQNHKVISLRTSGIRKNHHERLSNKTLFIACILTIFTQNIHAQECEFTPTSIYELLKTHPEIEYIKCHDAQPFEYKPFPPSTYPTLQPNKGIFAQTFILKIPNGQAFSQFGFVKLDESNVILELLTQASPIRWHKLDLKQFKSSAVPVKIPGRVAVLAMANDTIYAHWICDILSRLALLESQGIEYDYLYVAHDKPFMKTTLALWGVDSKKIIQPFGANTYIQADELIVPSLTARRDPIPNEPFSAWVPLCEYVPQRVINDIRNKFLPLIQKTEYNFSKKVFISRVDSMGRRIINEDEMFALFEPLGFEKYTLATMPYVEQIALFHNAECIVGAHGAGLMNIIYCKPSTNIIEIFQERSSCTFCFMCQEMNLNYHYIKTTEFTLNTTDLSNIPLAPIQEFIDTNKALFQ